MPWCLGRGAKILYVIMLAGDNEAKVSKLAISRNKLSKKAC